MPEKATVKRARSDLRRGKSASTAAGEFVREEIHHVRSGKHGARSARQAIAIGLSKARRAGVPLKPPKPGQTSERTRRSAQREYEAGQKQRRPKSPSRRRSAAAKRALEHEPKRGVSPRALSTQAKRASQRRRASTSSTRR